MSIDTQEHDFPPLCTNSTWFGISCCFCCCFSSSGFHAAAGPSGLWCDSLWGCTCLAQQRGRDVQLWGANINPNPAERLLMKLQPQRGRFAQSLRVTHLMCAGLSPATAAYLYRFHPSVSLVHLSFGTVFFWRIFKAHSFSTHQFS